MQSYIKFFVILFFALFINNQAVYADGISSQVLIENGKSYDQKQVVYEGEVIGDIMRRGDFAWINVNDGSNAMGVFINYSDIDKITNTGTYKSTGDIIRVKGIFHRACPEHGGDMDIHASSLEVIKPGTPITHIIPIYKAVLGIIFPLLSLLLYILYRRSIKMSINKKQL